MRVIQIGKRLGHILLKGPTHAENNRKILGLALSLPRFGLSQIPRKFLCLLMPMFSAESSVRGDSGLILCCVPDAQGSEILQRPPLNTC